MVRVGKLLEEERIRRDISLEEVGKATKIRVSYLMALEQGEYHKLPSSAYINGFIKNYVDYLGLPQKEYLALFRREFNEKEHLRVLPQSLTPKEELPFHRFKFNNTVFGGAVLFVLLLTYLLFQYRYAVINPPLSILSPKEGEVLSRSITLMGQTDPDATVIVNEIPVAVDSNGKFTKQVSLFPGKTTIRIKAQNRIGKETEIERHVEVKEK